MLCMDKNIFGHYLRASQNFVDFDAACIRACNDGLSCNLVAVTCMKQWNDRQHLLLVTCNYKSPETKLDLRYLLWCHLILFSISSLV